MRNILDIMFCLRMWEYTKSHSNQVAVAGHKICFTFQLSKYYHMLEVNVRVLDLSETENDTLYSILIIGTSSQVFITSYCIVIPSQKELFSKIGVSSNP